MGVCGEEMIGGQSRSKIVIGSWLVFTSLETWLVFTSLDDISPEVGLTGLIKDLSISCKGLISSRYEKRISNFFIGKGVCNFGEVCNIRSVCNFGEVCNIRSTFAIKKFDFYLRAQRTRLPWLRKTCSKSWISPQGLIHHLDARDKSCSTLKAQT